MSYVPPVVDRSGSGMGVMVLLFFLLAAVVWSSRLISKVGERIKVISFGVLKYAAYVGLASLSIHP